MATQEVKGKSKEQATKELALKANSSSLVLTPELQGSWGAEEATAADILIPKVLLMQGMSEKVMDGTKSQGEIVKSTDFVTLAARDEKFKVIPFKMWKSWRIMELVGKKYEFRTEEPWTASNTDLPWDYTVGEKTMRRDQAFNFYAIEADPVGSDFPMRLQFVRTSRRAGQTIADHFAHSRLENTPPALRTFEIGNEYVNGADNKYFRFTAQIAGSSTIEQLTSCKKWFDVMAKNKNTGNIKDHDVADTEPATITKEEF